MMSSTTKHKSNHRQYDSSDIVKNENVATIQEEEGGCDEEPERTQPQHHFSLSHANEEVKYYRIVYKGVVALLSEPESKSKKSGAYVSYGEIIASSHQLERYVLDEDNGDFGGDDKCNGPSNDTSTDETSRENVMGERYNQKMLNASKTQEQSFPSVGVAPPSPSKSYKSSGSDTSTGTAQSSATLPIAPSSQAVSQYNNVNHYYSPLRKKRVVKIIRVDEVLTGGYAVDMNAMQNKHNQIEEYDKDVSSTNTKQDFSSKSLYSQELKHRRHGHGYLLQHHNNISIAEQIPSPPLLCQPGTFFYRVTSSMPLPILTGPCADAPVTRGVALPGSVHEISLRVGSLDYHFPGSNSCVGRQSMMEDGIVYLRLGHKRGWIADRRILVQIQQQHPQHLSPNRNGLGYNGHNIRSQQQQKVVVVMKEVTDFVDAFNCTGSSSGINDDMMSLGGTSVSSASIATPASVVRTRRRLAGRRRKDCQDRVLVHQHHHGQHSKYSQQQQQLKVCVESGSNSLEMVSSPISDVTIVSDLSLNGTVTAAQDDSSLIHKSGISTVDHSANALNNSLSNQCNKSSNNSNELSSSKPNSVRKKECDPNLFLIRVTAPQGLKILDAPHFQVNNLIRGQLHSTSLISPGHSSFSITTNGLPSKNNNKSTSSTSTISKSASLTSHNSMNPSSIFHTMTGSSTTASVAASTHDNQRDSLHSHNQKYHPITSCSWEFDTSGKTRILRRGTLFEASKRKERAGAYYTPGAGLIKLADNTGWAVVPTREELNEQYMVYKGGLTGGVSDGEALYGYEEVGNAIMISFGSSGGDVSVIDRTDATGAKRRKWLRIIHPSGVLVTCLPPYPLSHHPGGEDSNYQSASSSSSPSQSFSGEQTTSQSESYVLGQSNSQESDTASAVGSVFGTFRSPRKRQDIHHNNQVSVSGAGDKGHGLKISPHAQLLSMRANQANAVIPCGMCVEVEPWESYDSQKNKQHYVRLLGSQGWIPRMIHGNPYAADIPPPNIRHGSFWFRVLSINGIKVRTGPSLKANPIKSEEDVYFRFECGEFLRASEVLTIFGLNNLDGNKSSDKIPINNDNASSRVNCRQSESFAKLYRNNHSRRTNERVNGQFGRGPSKIDHMELSSLILPGEWVFVHCDNDLFLEECVNPPAIQRHQDGWKYDVALESGVEIRVGPSFSAKNTGKILKKGDRVLVNERVTANGDKLTWLRLKDGQGWVHNIGPDGKMVMVLHAEKVGTKGTPSVIDKSSSIITRLFQSDSINLK